jgi:hypothetical protein
LARFDDQVAPAKTGRLDRTVVSSGSREGRVITRAASTNGASLLI